MIKASELFDKYFRTNVQLGLADILEIESIANGINIRTTYRVAQIGLKDNFNHSAILKAVDAEFKKKCDNKINITTHVSSSIDNENTYLYYRMASDDSVIGISLANISEDKTTVTTICADDYSNILKTAIESVVVDDHHPCYVLIAGQNGIKETRRSIRKSSEPQIANCFYPFLKQDVHEYFDNYLKSDASILILMGPAGTGKSTFIRNLILHSMKPACLVYDPDTITSPLTLDHFYNSSYGIMGLEDADAFIGAREDGNQHLAGYLNYADGVVKDNSKKIVISTNLASLKKIDSALYRKGRCYDVINFEELNQEQIDKVREYVGLEYKQFDKSVVLAEALGKSGEELQENRKRSFGFLG